MITATTAKILLFIALTLRPSDPSAIFCTSNNENYTWTPQSCGWHLDAPGAPASNYFPSKTAMFSGSPHKSDVPSYVREIASHDWSHDSIVVLSNGDRVEKKGDHAYYIVNAGAPNEKDFTIFYDINK